MKDIQIKKAAEDEAGKLEEPTIYKYNNRKYMWKEDIYFEWYEYAKLNDNSINSFRNWFDAELFAEPLKTDAIKVLSHKGNKLVLEINLTYDLHRLAEKLKNLVIRYSKKNKHTFSRATYQPSKSEKDISVSKLKERRMVYLLREEGKSNLEMSIMMGFITSDVYDYKLATKGMKNNEKQSIADESDFLESQYLKAERRIQRNIKQCKETLKQIEKGTFP